MIAGPIRTRIVKRIAILLSLPFLWYEQQMWFENGKPVDGCRPTKHAQRVKREKRVKAIVLTPADENTTH
jgi:hypothetical protein